MYEWLRSALPLGTSERYMEMEHAALQGRAGGKMARALDHPVEGEGWNELKHIALEQQSPIWVGRGLPSNGDADELHIVALALRNEHDLK